MMLSKQSLQNKKMKSLPNLSVPMNQKLNLRQKPKLKKKLMKQ